MSEPYLILHKVRGEPAFDIAILCKDMGTELDPGPWWIIPTSGHRAYPFKEWQLDNLAGISDINRNGNHDEPWMWDHHLPEDWPDHCQYDIDRRASADKSPIQSLDVAKALANLIPTSPTYRRKL